MINTYNSSYTTYSLFISKKIVKHCKTLQGSELQIIRNSDVINIKKGDSRPFERLFYFGRDFGILSETNLGFCTPLRDLQGVKKDIVKARTYPAPVLPEYPAALGRHVSNLLGPISRTN